MAISIPQRDLRNRNAQIVAEVMRGESFVITRDGTPVAELTPYVDDPTPPRFVRVSDLTEFLAPGRLDGAAWMRDIRDADDEGPEDPWDRHRG